MLREYHSEFHNIDDYRRADLASSCIRTRIHILMANSNEKDSKPVLEIIGWSILTIVLVASTYESIQWLRKDKNFQFVATLTAIIGTIGFLIYINW